MPEGSRLLVALATEWAKVPWRSAEAWSRAGSRGEPGHRLGGLGHRRPRAPRPPPLLGLPRRGSGGPGHRARPREVWSSHRPGVLAILAPAISTSVQGAGGALPGRRERLARLRTLTALGHPDRGSADPAASFHPP